MNYFGKSCLFHFCVMELNENRKAKWELFGIFADIKTIKLYKCHYHENFIEEEKVFVGVGFVIGLSVGDIPGNGQGPL